MRFLNFTENSLHSSSVAFLPRNRSCTCFRRNICRYFPNLLSRCANTVRNVGLDFDPIFSGVQPLHVRLHPSRFQKNANWCCGSTVRPEVTLSQKLVQSSTKLCQSSCFPVKSGFRADRTISPITGSKRGNIDTGVPNVCCTGEIVVC